MYTIGIDIGGTKIYGILTDGRGIIGSVRFLNKEKTRKSFFGVAEKIISTLRAAIPSGNVARIGLGVPSPLDAAKTTVLNSPNFPGLRGIKLVEVLGGKVGLPVRMENDARCFVLGAALDVSRRHFKKKGIVVGLTLGTGLGGALLVNGGLWAGAHNSAGEMGHTVINPAGPKCACGRRGCLEMFVSKKFLLRSGGRRQPKELEAAAKKGDKKAISAYHDFGNYLGFGAANIVNFYDPDVIVLGGGIAKAHGMFLAQARKTAREHILSPRAKNTPIVVARNLDDAGALGAVMLWR